MTARNLNVVCFAAILSGFTGCGSGGEEKQAVSSVQTTGALPLHEQPRLTVGQAKAQKRKALANLRHFLSAYTKYQLGSANARVAQTIRETAAEDLARQLQTPVRAPKRLRPRSVHVTTLPTDADSSTGRMPVEVQFKYRYRNRSSSTAIITVWLQRQGAKWRVSEMR